MTGRCILMVSAVLFGLAPAAAEPVLTLERGFATDIWITWPDEAGWSAPGFLDVFPEWRRSVKPEAFAAMKRQGFDFVRLTIDPAPFLWQPSVEKTAKLAAGVKSAVALLHGEGLSVLVDVHSIPDGGTRTLGIDQYLRDGRAFATYLTAVTAIGEAIAGEDPATTGFEPVNEPTIDCEAGTPPRWPAMARTLHATARAAAPRLTLVMQGACWGSAAGLAGLDPAQFGDANIIWSFHSYEPFLLTHQGASWVEGPPRFIGDLHYPPEQVSTRQRREIERQALERIARSGLPAERRAELKAELRAALADYVRPGWAQAQIGVPMDRIGAWATQHAIPPNRILLGEFGVIKSDAAAELPAEVRAPVIEATRKAAEAHGFAWSVWGHGGSFAITRDDTSRLPDPDVMRALGLGTP